MIHQPDGRPAAGSAITIVGGAGFRLVIHSGSAGEFAITLPYGRYEVAGAVVFVAPFETTRMDLVKAANLAGTWTDVPRARRYPEALSLPGLLLARDPPAATQPLDFAGLSDNRLAVVSQRGYSWTDTQYRLEGIDATDSYQPGRTVIFPDVDVLEAEVVRSAFSQDTSLSSGTEVGLFLAEPGKAWHGALSTMDTGAALAWNNLPQASSRGLVEQVDRFQWMTRDGAEVGGPLARWADFFASARGQWAEQSEPLLAPGTEQRSRLLFANARGRVRASVHDQLEALYSGSRIDLSDGGIPAGIEALMSNRLAPSFVLPGGFAGEPEVDHLDFVQVGWTHFAGKPGVLQVRYGYSVAHLDTGTMLNGQSRIELAGGMVTGAPPLANLAVRPHHEFEAAWEPTVLRTAGVRHALAIGADAKTTQPRNRFQTPSGTNLVTADGVPAFAIEYNTPVDSRELLRSLSGYLADQIRWRDSLTVVIAAVADVSRGSLPSQTSPAGAFVGSRSFPAQNDLIAWNSISPRTGFAWRAPHAHGLILRGTYLRLDEPLAGRYLDFGNPDSLGGSVFQWNGSNVGGLLLRFGGPYSSISPALRRPYADEFDVGAEVPLTGRSTAGIRLFRRDDKDRIAAIDTGVPASAFTPVTILDPGPDGIPGTFDDQRLTVYAQNPATLGQDRYLLTNPPGLRMLHEGFVAEIGTGRGSLMLHASFVAEKSWGPANPGDAVYENDPGVIGALFLDPNTAINAAGHSFLDRAFVGKVQAGYRLPARWGGIEVASVANYLDGLPFARQLLVTGLPQGPFLVATTVRGSPEGGNRSQFVTNWNLRLSREFEVGFGRVRVTVDCLNVTNAAQRLQEEDLSGPLFNLRLPVAIQAARFVRLGMRYEF